jgi:hypothetical protein
LADGLAFASVASVSALKGCTRERAIATCRFLLTTTATRTTQIAATRATTFVVTVDDASGGDAIALTARLCFFSFFFAEAVGDCGDDVGDDVGDCVGLMVGDKVGLLVGIVVGDCVGLLVGLEVGDDVVGLVVGDCVGLLVGLEVGDVVGLVVGDCVGLLVGLVVGDVVGLVVGDCVGLLVGLVVGDAVGLVVGDCVGLLVGLEVGDVVGLVVGDCVGLLVGDVVGDTVGDVVGDAVKTYSSTVAVEAVYTLLPTDTGVAPEVMLFATASTLARFTDDMKMMTSTALALGEACTVSVEDAMSSRVSGGENIARTTLTKSVLKVSWAVVCLLSLAVVMSNVNVRLAVVPTTVGTTVGDVVGDVVGLVVGDVVELVVDWLWGQAERSTNAKLVQP